MQTGLWAPTLNELRQGRKNSLLVLIQAAGAHLCALSAYFCAIRWRWVPLVCLLKKWPECTLLHKLTKGGGSGTRFDILAQWFELQSRKWSSTRYIWRWLIPHPPPAAGVCAARDEGSQERRFLLQLLTLCRYDKAYLKDHRRENISCSVFWGYPSGLNKSCASVVSQCLFMCISRNGRGTAQLPRRGGKSSAEDVGRLQV